MQKWCDLVRLKHNSHIPCCFNFLLCSLLFRKRSKYLLMISPYRNPLIRNYVLSRSVSIRNFVRCLTHHCVSSTTKKFGEVIAFATYICSLRLLIIKRRLSCLCVVICKLTAECVKSSPL